MTLLLISGLSLIISVILSIVYLEVITAFYIFYKFTGHSTVSLEDLEHKYEAIERALQALKLAGYSKLYRSYRKKFTKALAGDLLEILNTYTQRPLNIIYIKGKKPSVSYNLDVNKIVIHDDSYKPKATLKNVRYCLNKIKGGHK